MAYGFKTKKGTAATLAIPAIADVAGYTLTVEFSRNYDFRSILSTKSVTGTAKTVTLSLSAAEVDTLKDVRYRLKGVKNGKTVILQTGVIDYIIPISSTKVTPEQVAQADTALDTRLKAAESLLAAATAANTADSIVKRNSSRVIAVQEVQLGAVTPAGASSATRKDYVDTYGALTPMVVANQAGPGVGITPAMLPSTRVWTMTGNITLSFSGSFPTDRSGLFRLVLRQDSTGGRTLTWPAGITWLSTVPVMPTAPGSVLYVELVWTGTEWLGIAPEADLAAATDQSTASTLMRRDPSGWTRANRFLALSSPPTQPNELTRKDWVEANGALASAQSIATGATQFLPAAPATRTYTLSANLTITGLPATSGDRSGVITLVLKQPASGGPYTITWPTGIAWAGGAPAPAMPTVANSELIVNLLWTGAAWRGVVGGIYYP